MEDSESILHAAEDVLSLLQKHGIDAVVIGDVALAAYHYIRKTEDIDLGVNADLRSLQALAASLTSAGYSLELREPYTQDSLGGVIDLRGHFGLLQIISFAGRFSGVIEDALGASTLRVRQGSPLKIVPLPHLIALKLYAGGHKSQADIVELLQRNPGLDIDTVRALCHKYRLSGLEELIEEADLNERG